VLGHIGLVKERGGHLVNQLGLSLFEKSWKTTIGDQISIMKSKTKNERAQSLVKKMCRWKRIPMYTGEWIEFKWRNLCTCCQKKYQRRWYKICVRGLCVKLLKLRINV